MATITKKQREMLKTELKSFVDCLFDWPERKPRIVEEAHVAIVDLYIADMIECWTQVGGWDEKRLVKLHGLYKKLGGTRKLLAPATKRPFLEIESWDADESTIKPDKGE